MMWSSAPLTTGIRPTTEEIARGKCNGSGYIPFSYSCLLERYFSYSFWAIMIALKRRREHCYSNARTFCPSKTSHVGKSSKRDEQPGLVLSPDVPARQAAAPANHDIRSPLFLNPSAWVADRDLTGASLMKTRHP